MKHKLKELVSKLLKTGFFSIYLSTICSKVITLLGGVLIVRVLSQEDYGIYTLVINAVAMMSIFGDFGASGATLQYAIESEKNKEKQQAFFTLGIKMSMGASILSSILILLSPIFYPYQNDTIEKLTLILFGIPILTSLINYVGIILRVKRANNKYSIYQVIITLVHYTTVIIATLLFGLKGSLVCQYLYNLITLIIGYIFIRKSFKLNKTKEIRKNEKKGFFKIALGTQLNNTINHLLYTVDIFTLGIMNISSTDISIYKVATIIPTALVFLPQCLNIYIFPYFVSHNQDAKWIKHNINKILKYMALAYGIITLGGIAFSKIIIRLLYGQEYMGAVVPFILLLIGFFFVATIKNFFGNIIYSFHKVKFSIVLSTTAIILDVIFNIILIKIFGFVGVAISTMAIDVITSLISILYLKKCVKELEVNR